MRWILTKDRLPDVGKTVCVKDIDGEYFSASTNQQNKWTCDNTDLGGMSLDVVCWLDESEEPKVNLTLSPFSSHSTFKL